MTEPQKYIGKAIEVVAVRLGQYGDFVRTTEWVKDNGGAAYFTPQTVGQSEDTITLFVDQDILHGFQGDYVLQGVTGEFSIVHGAIFEASYDKVPENHSAEWDVSPSVYQPKGQPGHSLLGAAAVVEP